MMVEAVLAAMMQWVSGKPNDAAFYREVAADIVAVAPDYKRAIDLATLAYFEGRFLRWVDSGVCNRRTTSKERAEVGMWNGACDASTQTYQADPIDPRKRVLVPLFGEPGIAYSLWQIHADQGIVLEPGGEWHNVTDDDVRAGTKVYRGKDLLASRQLAARVALAMLVKSERMCGGSWAGYSGEGGNAPKARARQDFARRWRKAHPFTP